MSTWKIEQIGKKPKLKTPILIEGLPGIGNVGKVAVDFIIEELKAKKIFELSSYTLPHSVFVNEENLIELPCIEIYYKQFKGKRDDLLLLAGDVQPIDEQSCYEFSEAILDIVSDFNGKEIITLGGIGLQSIPKKPKVYCTGNNKKLIKDFKKKTGVHDDLYGIVGPIIGVSGVLLGMAQKRNIKAVTLLAETFGHPMYLGVNGAREIVKVLNKKLNLKLRLKNLDKEIAELESEIMKKTKDLSDVSKRSALRKIKSRFIKETNYIG